MDFDFKPLLHFLFLTTVPPFLFGDGNTALQSEFLSPRSQPSEKTLFTTLHSSDTGIRCVNSFSDPSMWGENYDRFALGSSGTGVAVGDFDGDGLPDVYIVNKCDPDRLYKNLGNWHFEDVTEKSGVFEPTDGSWKQAAAFVDVNGDGHLDLFVSRVASTNLLFINQGNGSFLEEAKSRGLALYDASGVGAFADYDGDGWLDLYLQTNLLDPLHAPQGQRDHLFRNKGKGYFEDVSDAAGIHGETHGHSATWWDFNNDGWADIYVANDFAAPDQLYRNNHDGTFTDVLGAVLPHTPLFSMGSDLGDVNNDGRIDLMAADMAPMDHRKNLRSMAEMQRLQVELPDPSLPTQYIRNALYLNTGGSVFQEVACLTGMQATDWTWTVRFEDLDNDGMVDAFFTNGMIRDFFDADLLARCANFSRDERLRAIKAAPILKEKNLAFRNLGQLNFKEIGGAWGLDEIGVSFGAAFGDLDGDGDLDLIYANFQGAPTLCRNDSTTGHRVVIRLRGAHPNTFGIGATVRIETASGIQVRTLVVARGYMSASEPLAHFGLGNDTEIRHLTVSWPSGLAQTFESLEVDRRYTVEEPESGSKDHRANESLATFKHDGVSTQFTDVSERLGLSLASEGDSFNELKDQPLLPFRQNRFGPGLAVGDLNADGRDDLIIGGTSGQPARFALQNKAGDFETQSISSRKDWISDGAPLLVDVDGDGNRDLFLPKGGVTQPAGSPFYQPMLVMNRGGGRFKQAPTAAIPLFAGSVGACVAADFDRDGRLDLFLAGRVTPGAYGEPGTSALWLNRNSGYKDITDTVAPALRNRGLIESVLVTDIDNDRWPDLLIALQWGGVECWHNDEGAHFSDWSERLGFNKAGRGFWNSIASADFNGDGKLDYAVGNLGLNTPYQASASEPMVLYRGALEEGKPFQLLEAKAIDGTEIPWRNRTALCRAMPSLLKRIPSFEAFARSTLPRLFSEDSLKVASRLQVDQLQSGVFLSRSDHSYDFVPLPRDAQIAPINGMAAVDFDGDGKADLCFVQNSFSPIPETGHFDGGLGMLLLGDGNGGFSSVPAHKSGIEISGDGEALVLMDFNNDAWPDLVVSRNSGSTIALQNMRSLEGHMFSVELIGPLGNPTAAGALIDVCMEDGKHQLSEVTLGGGYLSQSSSSSFFGYKNGTKPTRIEVTWPDGKHSSHAWSPDSARITIAFSNATN